jgi:putative intracellular protease/amidase
VVKNGPTRQQGLEQVFAAPARQGTVDEHHVCEQIDDLGYAAIVLPGGQAAGPDGAFEPGPLWSTSSNGWCLVDRNLVTARWPGDAEVWAKRLVETVQDSIEAVPTEMISS